MVKMAVREAKERLDELVDEASKGETVVLSRTDGSKFQLVPYEERRPTPRLGFAKGKIRMADDFDEPLKDFDEYMP